MKLIDRYLLREYLFLLTCCLGGFCMLYLVLGLFEHAPTMLEAGEPLWYVLWFCARRLVVYTDSANICFVVFVMPISILASALYCLFKLNRQNELTAMRASGMSLLRLVRPYLAVGLLFSLAATWMQERLAPEMSRKNAETLARVRGKSERTSVFANYKYFDDTKHRRWSIGCFDAAQPDVLRNVQITFERPDRTRSRIISAGEARWRDNTWILRDVTTTFYGEDDEPAGTEQPAVETLAMPELTETPRELQIEADPENAAKYMSALAWLRYLKQRGSKHAGRLVAQEVNTHMRLAMPWACLVVSLISIPAGVRGGRRSILASVAAAFLVLLGFYVAMQASMVLGKKMILAPWASAWLPNALFFVVGLIGVSRME